MEQEIILSKQSSSEDLKRYFTAVLELSKQDNEFPINLDDVWMLVYKEKGKAVRALKRDFIEGEDFISFAQNGKREIGGTQTMVYHLSISCLEYFIARKVRPVFDVYRKVFHKVANNEVKLPTAKELALMVVKAEEEKERLMLENKDKQEQIERKQEVIDLQAEQISKSAPKVEYYDNVLQSVNTLTATQVAKTLGMADANRLNKKLIECGMCYRQSGQMLLRAPYSTWALHATRTQTYTRSDGSTGTSSYTVYTQRGLLFIRALSQNDWDIKKALRSIKGEKEATFSTNSLG